MPRNGSGSYILPSGNPVVTGTTISSTWANNTLTDIGNALTQSLSADGQTVATGNIPMGGNKFTNLGAGTLSGDSLRWEQLFSQGTEQSLASAATVDIGNVNTCFINITGTTTITSLGTNYNGPRYLRFAATLSLTNSASLVLPGGQNLNVNAGDVVIAYPISGPAWKVISYTSATQFNSGPVVGSSRNFRVTIAAASASATMAADEIIVSSSVGGSTYKLSGFSKTINLATTGAGGMDTGTAPVSGYVGIYAIYNPTTNVSALLAVNATSGVISEVYAGANRPSGYDYSALLSVLPTNASSQFMISAQRDRLVSRTESQAFTTNTNVGAVTAISISGSVPPNAKWISGSLECSSTSATAGYTFNIAADTTPVGVKRFTGVLSTAGQTEAKPYTLQLTTQQSMAYALTVGAGTPTATIRVSEYSF